MKRQPSEFYLRRWEELANRLPEKVHFHPLENQRFTHEEFVKEYLQVPHPSENPDFAERAEAKRREEIRQTASNYKANRFTKPCNETPPTDPNRNALIGKTVNIIVQNETARQMEGIKAEQFERMIREVTMKELTSGIHPIVGARIHDELSIYMQGGRGVGESKDVPCFYPQERLVVQKGRQEGVATAYQLLNQKGTTMNINTIANLATNNTDEFSKYDELPENLKKALKRKMKEKEETAADEAADTILQILELSERTVKDRVIKIRSLRAQEITVKASIVELERCRAYGMKTQNFLPMAKHLGYNVSMLVSDQKFLEVPADFKVDAKQ